MDWSKPPFVGKYFEGVLHRVIGGELRRDEAGDIYIPELDATIEIKSSGSRSSYGFRLDHRQIDNYESRVERGEVRTSCYALFSYANSDIRDSKGRRTTEFASRKTPRMMNSFLSARTEWGLIVDISLVTAWRNAFPVSEKSVPGHLGTRTTDIKVRSYLSKLVPHGLKQEVERLTNNQSDLVVMMVTVGRKKQPGFPVYFVLKRKDAKIFSSRLVERGFCPKVVR